MLGRSQALLLYRKTVAPKPSVTLSSGTGSNVTYTLNQSTAYSFNDSQTTNTYGTFSKTGYNVYFINNTKAVSTNSTATSVTGTFTLTVSGATATIYYAVCGGGGGGAGGNVCGGGGSAGELKYGSITLPVGIYSCSLSIGTGGCGATSYVASSPTFGENINGYGYHGSTSSLTINGTTISCDRGMTGGCSGNSHPLTTGFVLGGGGGGNLNFGNGPENGGVGTSHSGGKASQITISGGAMGGGGGASNEANGNDAATQSNSSAGAFGGAPTPSSKFPTGLQFNTVCYFAEGGHGGNCRNSGGAVLNGIQTTYKLAGKNAGAGGAANDATQVATNSCLGSGGSGRYGAQGTSTADGNHAGSGGNGFIFLSWAQ